MNSDELKINTNWLISLYSTDFKSENNNEQNWYAVGIVLREGRRGM